MIPLDPLGEALELRVPASERHERGQYFTPDALVRFVLDLVENLGSGRAGSLKILDPACGSGRFLLGARERWGPRAELHGYETDLAARESAMAQLGKARIHGDDFLAAPGQGDFDLIVGNPPYLRRRGAKTDLYVDFIERSLVRLREGGRLALVLSNAWLSVGYGREVARILRNRAAIEWVLESGVESWFPGASVNTMILVVRRCGSAVERDTQSVRFTCLQQRLDEIAPVPVSEDVALQGVRRLRQCELPLDRAWAPLLRAPEGYLELVRSSRLASLGSLAELRRGYTTNDNAFFYPGPDQGIESRYLRPLFKSPRDVRSLRFDAGDLAGRVFICSLTREELRESGDRRALGWVNLHRRGRPSSDWALRRQEPLRLFLMKGYHDRFRQPLSDEPLHFDQQIYGLRPKREDDLSFLAAAMNSAWFQLSLELVARVNFGDGVLWLGLADAREGLRLPDPKGLPKAERDELVAAFEALPDDDVPSVRDRDVETKWAEGRERLDRAMAACLAVSWESYLELAAAGRRLCERRLQLAALRRGRG